MVKVSIVNVHWINMVFVSSVMSVRSVVKNYRVGVRNVIKRYARHVQVVFVKNVRINVVNVVKR